MQLIAEKEGKKIWAHEAKRGETYICPNCKYSVKRRGGYLKRAHFYHLYAGPKCQGSNKSIQHLQTQIWISKLFREKTVEIERPFPEIDRIADVYWPEKKIVFEVQYSAISYKKMIERNRDYASIGIYTVWILHSRMFTPTLKLEENLKGVPHYYTNINSQGQGYIFDRLYTVDGLTNPFIVNLASPRRVDKRPKFLPKCLIPRFNSSIYFFEGDLIDQSDRSPHFMPKPRFKQLSHYHRFINRQISENNTL